MDAGRAGAGGGARPLTCTAAPLCPGRRALVGLHRRAGSSCGPASTAHAAHELLRTALRPVCGRWAGYLPHLNPNINPSSRHAPCARACRTHAPRARACRAAGPRAPHRAAAVGQHLLPARARQRGRHHVGHAADQAGECRAGARSRRARRSGLYPECPGFLGEVWGQPAALMEMAVCVAGAACATSIGGSGWLHGHSDS